MKKPIVETMTAIPAAPIDVADLRVSGTLIKRLIVFDNTLLSMYRANWISLFKRSISSVVTFNEHLHIHTVGAAVVGTTVLSDVVPVKLTPVEVE